LRFPLFFAVFFFAACAAHGATGFHATLKIDFNAYWAGRLDGWDAMLKERLNSAHDTFSDLKIEDARLSVLIPDAATRAGAKAMLARHIALAGGFAVEETDHRLVVSPIPGYRKETEHNLLNEMALGVERRLSAITGRHVAVQTKLPDTIYVAVPHFADQGMIDKLFSPPASLDFYLVDEDASAKPLKAAPAGDIVLPFDNGSPQPDTLAVQATPFMSGERVVEAQNFISDITGHPSISVRFDEAGRDIFARITRENKLHRIAIAIDGRVICAPMIRGDRERCRPD
jgi:preprotein translocase subunit SecD